LLAPHSDNEKNHYRISIADSGLAFDIGERDTLLCGMLRSGIGVPYECNAGGCGSCKFTLIEGEVVDDIENTAGLRSMDRRKNRHLSCISHARSDCVIGIRPDAAYEPEIRPRRFTAVFLSAEPLTHDLWEFRFRSDEMARFQPGQYAKVSIPGVRGPRSYSMSNTTNNDGIWAFQIKRVPDGEASTLLFDQELDQMTVTIDAPYSIAHLQVDSPRSVVCIAGGSGLAPMVSILHGFAERHGGADTPMLYYGARTAEDVIDPGYFSRITGFEPDSQYVPIVSEPDTGRKWPGATGFVHEYLSEALPEDGSNIDFYIAGPPPMVDAVRRHLVLERKVPVDHLYYDRFF
jgi:toluene monooxygenase electron transfer component